MDLIERYLGAVRWNLPAGKADDIVAELADLIAARIEDREEALGRPLTKDEVSKLLKEFGHPLAVAGQYHGQRALIGPELFPFYWFALKVVLAIVLVIEAIQIGGHIVTGGAFPNLVLHGADGVLHSLLYNAALVTLAFAVVERTGWLGTYLEKWKPEELPDLSSLRLRNPGRARRRQLWAPIANLAFGIAFLAWWAGAFAVPVFPHDADVAVRGAPVWAVMFWPVVALVSARMLLGLVALFRPAWKPLRAALILGCTAGTLAICAVLHQAGRIVTVTGADPDKAAAVQTGLDQALAIAVIVVGATTVWQGAVELWRLYGERR